MNLRQSLLPILTAALAFGASGARAAVFCVSSGPQLQTAINQAEANGEIDEIRLKPGLYFATPQAAGEASFDYLSTEPLIVFGVTVDGNNNCTTFAARSDQAVLSGVDQFPVMRIRANSGASGAWSIAHLTITDGLATAGNVGGLDLRARPGSAAIMSAINLIIRDCNSNGDGNPLASALRVYAEDSDSALRVLGSVIRNNRSSQFAPVLLTGEAGTGISFSNNTIAFNAGDAEVGPVSATDYAVETGGGGSVFLSNNVFHANTRGSDLAPADFSADTDFVSLQMDHNHINALSAAGVVDNFRTQGDPRFVSDSDLRLRVNSPLRNSGNNTPQGGLWSVDVEGSLRVQGGVVDRGAYEFGELLINGFE